jgi:hypothetical protein
MELVASDEEFFTMLIGVASGRLSEKDIREFIQQNIR